MEKINHPFPFIKELEFIKDINKFEDILEIRNFVYSLIPWTEKNENLGDIKEMYVKFKEKKYGGWCGLHAKFFQALMLEYNIPCKVLNFGINGYGITHVANIVTYLNNDYFIDSYFAKHYVNEKKEPIIFDTLIELIKKRKFENIFTSYGFVKKWLQKKNSWEKVDPKVFEKIIISFFESKNMDNILKKIFGCNDFRILMLIEIPSFIKKDDFYYESIEKIS